MIESLDNLKETVTELTNGSAKEKKKLVTAAIINVGFYLNADYQPHMDIIEERNTKLESTVDEQNQYVKPKKGTDGTVLEPIYALTTNGQPICLIEYAAEIANSKDVHVLQIFDWD